MRPKGRTKSTPLSPESQKAKKEAQKKMKKVKEGLRMHMQNARSYFVQGNLESAHMNAGWACEVVMEENLDDTEPFELLGEIKIDFEDLEGAKECFFEAVRRREKVPVEKSQDGDEAKFQWLGQLSTGQEAVEWYLKGTEVLKVLAQQDSFYRVQLSTTFCSLVEIYLTDLW
jgi:hypothetical protein